MPHPTIQLLKELIRHRSLSHQENEIATYLESYVQDTGLQRYRLDNNVYFSLGRGAPRLLLNSHLDVVPPAEGRQQFDPEEIQGCLYGRGAVDAKSSVAAMTAALLALARQGWAPARGQVIAAFTACEETGGEDNGLKMLRPHLPPLDAALVGEPTSLQPVVAQKGLLILKALARGKSAHAARAALGVNAITIAAADIALLQTHSLGDADPVLGPPTMSVTTIEGGSARNMVPERCVFYVDIRTVPGQSHEAIAQHLNALLRSEVTIHSGRIIPVSTPTDARIVQSCLRALPGTAPMGSPTASDWIHLHDLPVVKIGPGSSALSHTADEHVAITEVLQAQSAYMRIIKDYFSASPDGR